MIILHKFIERISSWKNNVENTDITTNMIVKSDSDSNIWDSALFEILNRKEGKYRIISEQMRIDELKICLKEGGSLGAKDGNKNTLLHIAVEKEFTEVVNFLLKENPDILNTENEKGETAIEIARKLQKNEMSKILNNWSTTERIPLPSTSQPTLNQHDQIKTNDISDRGKENNEAPTLVPASTRADGNCFFHAVFGEKNSVGQYETKLANEMRLDFHKFLSQYKSLQDKNIPTELRGQLKKVFSLFLDTPEYLTDRLCHIKNSVAEANRARKYCEVRVKELKEIIAEEFFRQEQFQKDILEILFPSKDSTIIGNENDRLTNKEKLINKISNCLEDCALKLYPDLTRSEYKKKYNSETVADNFLEGLDIFENYKNAITSNRYHIFFEEVPIFSALGNIAITILYQDNGEHCSKTFEPNDKLLGDFVPEGRIWGKKDKAVIYHEGSHFSYIENSFTEKAQIQAIDQEHSVDTPIISHTNTMKNQNENKVVDSKNGNINSLLPPLSNALKLDKKLKWINFKELLSVPSDHNKEINANEFDTDVFPSVCVLVELSDKVYIDNKGKSDKTYERELNLPQEWILLTTAANTTNGYFGAAFWNCKFSQLVVAHQGTRNLKDVCTDVYGIVLEKYAGQMNSAVTFTHHVIRITNDIVGSGWQLVFTGHSLGGWLAQVTSFSAEFLRSKEDYFIKTDSTGIHAHCVAFDSPGCDAMLRKLTKDFDLRYDGIINPDKLDITTYLSSPNRVNSFNLHFGTLYRIFPDFSKMTMKEKYTAFYTLAAHNIKRISETFVEINGNLRKEKDLKIQEVVDWPLAGFLKRGEEYKSFFNWANHLNNYHPPFWDKKLTIDEHMRLRYQTKEVDKRSCSLGVFSSNELLLLESWTTINKENIILPKIEDFTNKNKLGNYKTLLPEFTIDKEKKKLYCQSKPLLDTLINRTKLLMRRFSTPLTQAVKNQLVDLPTAVETIYMVESKNFLESITGYDVHFNDQFGLQEFLNSDVEQIMCITSEDVYFDTARIHNICERIQKQNIVNTQTNEKNYIQNENIIVLNWKQILNLKTYIESHGRLVSKSSKCDLVIISFPPEVELNDNTKLVLKDVLSGGHEKRTKKLIFVTSKQCDPMGYITSNNTGDKLNFCIKEAQPVCLSDLTLHSKSKILDKPLLDLQGTQFKLGQLFNINVGSDESLNRLKEILDSYLLKNLLVAKAPEIKIQNHSMEMHEKVAYTKIGKVVSIENASHFIINAESVLKDIQKPIVFFISFDGKEYNDAEKLANHLNILEREQVEKIKAAWGTNIVVTTEHENVGIKFHQFCREYIQKRIYWLELKSDSVFWHLVYDSDFYISRKLNDKFYLKLDISKVIVGDSYSDMFIFSNSSRDILIDLFNTEEKSKIVSRKKVIPFLKEEAAFRKFEEMKNSERPVHLVKVEDVENGSKKLVWIQSSGSIDNIRKYVMRNSDLVNENTFSQKNDKMILFKGEPGIGKSTTVFSLSKQMKSTWVIQKELKNCHSLSLLSSKLDIDIVVTFLLKDNQSTFDKMTEILLKECLTHKGSLPVLLIFDGFDEIKNEPKDIRSDTKLWKNNHEKFIQLLGFLKEETTANIWITSRTFLSTTIENSFSIFATEIEEFKTDERMRFFTNIWTSRLSAELKQFGPREEKLLEQYIQKLFEEAKSLLGKEISTFMGAPLQMWMIAEVAAPEAEIFTYSNDSFAIQSAISLQINNIYDLYQRFVEAKYDIYFQEKANLSSGLTIASRNMFIESFNRMHRCLAFQSLFPDNYKKFLGSKALYFGEESTRDEEIELNRIGLIQSNLCGEFNFLHQTFAEFFVAELLIIWLEKENGRHPQYSPLEELLLSKILLCPEFKVVRLFMNNILAVRKLPMDSLKFYAKRIWTESYKQKDLFLNKNCQTALHVVSEENCEYIVELILNTSNPTILEEIVPEFIDTSFFIASRDNFGHTAFYLAGQQKHDNVISRFIEFLNNNSEFVQKQILLSTLYGMAEAKDDIHVIHLLKCISEKGSENVQELTADIVKNWVLIPEFLETIIQKDLKKVKEMVHECPDSVTREYFVAVKDKQGKSALHFAAEGGLQEITEYLLQQKAPVNAVDETRRTPIHFAAINGFLDIVQLLHSHGSNIFLTDVYNMSTVAWSAREGRLRVVEFLVERDADMHVADRNGIDSVQHAAKSGHLEVVKLLMARGADIHRVDRFEKTALSWAARAGHLDVVKHLVSCGADAEVPDRHGFCAAQVAAKSNKWDVAKWLLNHGVAQTGDLLHRAVCASQWRVAEELVSMLPYGEGNDWFTSEGIWLRRIKRAKKWGLLTRLVSKGADPGPEAIRLIQEVLGKDLSIKQWNLTNHTHAKKEMRAGKQNRNKSKEHKQLTSKHVQFKKSPEEQQDGEILKEIRSDVSKENEQMNISIKRIQNECSVAEHENINAKKNNDKEQIIEEDNIEGGIDHKKREDGENDFGGMECEPRSDEPERDIEGGIEIIEDISKNFRGENNLKATKKEEMTINETTESQKQNLERIIRLGRVHFLESFIDASQNKNIHLEVLLSEVSQDLATKFIPLPPTMQEAVEANLVKFRLFSDESDEKQDDISLDDVKRCVELIDKAVSKLNVEYSDNEDVDNVFLHTATLIARYIHVLKRFLKPLSSVLPWNEMEFCLVIFLSSILKPQLSDETYFLILNKTTILNHLENFSKKLLEVCITIQKKDITSKGRLSGRIETVKKIIAQNPEFEALYNDYDTVKNVYSLNRIYSYVHKAISIDLKDDCDLGKVIIERTLQVLGECLKNTPDSPNVSDDIHRLLLNSAPRHAKDIITALRDSLSHADTLTQKFELESKKDSEFFELVQNDLKKMGGEVICILFRIKIDALKGFWEQILKCDSFEEVSKLSHRLKNIPSLEEYNFPFRKMELDKIKKFHEEIALEYVGHSLEHDAFFDRMKGIIESEESKILQVTENYKHLLIRLDIVLNHCWSIKSVKAHAMDVLDKIEFNITKLKEILPMIEEFNSKIAKSRVHKIKGFDMMFTVLVEVDRVPGIDEIKYHLSKKENKENQKIKNKIQEYFNSIESKLKSKSDREEFAEGIRVKIKLHESKTKLINYFNTNIHPTANLNENEINCLALFGDLKLEGKKYDDLRENYQSGNFSKCLNLVKTVNDNYQNLIKSMTEVSVFSVGKSVSALTTFFSFHKKLKSKINKAIEEVKEEIKMEIGPFYNKRISILENIMEKSVAGKDRETAIEMLVLEVTELLEHSSLLADKKKFLLEDSPVLVGKALRNYLAHGDPLIDIMPFNPRNSIFAHARELVRQGGDLITKGKLLRRPSKPVDFSQVGNRDSRREIMTAMQDAMFQAAKEGNLEEVLNLVSKGADPHGRSINGKSVLQFAIISDDIETFQFFLKQDITFDIKQTLIEAVNEGSINIVKRVCDVYSLDLNTKYFKDAYLIHRASKSGKTDVLEFLLTRIQDPDSLDEKGNNPLECAVRKGNKDAVEILLKHIRSLNNPQKLTRIIKMALCRGHSSIVLIILKHASELNLEIEKTSALLHYSSMFGQEKAVLDLISYGFSVNETDENGETPLYWALRQGYEETAVVLLQQGAEIDTNNHGRTTLLHLASRHDLGNVVKIILDKGFPVNTLDENGWTPLHSAAKNGHLGAVCILLDHGVDVNVRSKNEVYGRAGESGFTALHLAADLGNTEVVKEITKRHPETVNIRDDHLHTPLHWAARAGHVDVCAALVDAGADLNCANAEGVVPLHVSIFCDQRAVTKLLMEKGAETGLRAKNGASALMLACKACCIETVNALIAKGADVNDDSMSGFTPLHAAVENGSEEVVSALLDAGARGDAQDAAGETAVMKAVWRGSSTRILEMLLKKYPQAVNIPKENSKTPLQTGILNGFGDMVAILLKYGADVNLNYDEGVTCLSEAALHGHKEVVELLLEHGVGVNDPKEGPPLYSAIINDRREVAIVLIKNGADVNYIQNGNSLLMHAILEGYEDMAVILVEHGAEVNVREDRPEVKQVTPLCLALGKGYFRLSRALLKRGADPYEVSPGLSALHVAVGGQHCDVDMINFILDDEEEKRARRVTEGDGATQVLQGSKALVNIQDQEGRTPLHAACIHNRVDVFTTLLDRGADVNIANEDGRTPLHMAAVVCDAEIVLVLAGREATLVNIPNKYGRSALHLGCECGRAEVVRALLDNGALSNAIDHNGMTPLHIAASNGHAEVIRILVGKMVSLNAQNHHGHTALYLTSVEGHTNVVRALLEKGADINIADYELQTPTHMAAYRGHSGVISLLLGKEVHNTTLNAQDIEGRTALHYACSHGRTEIVIALLHKGADTKVVDSEGRTPLLIAAGNGHTDIVLLLTDKQMDSLNIQDKEGRSPLHVACAAEEIQVVRVLLNKGAQVNIRNNLLMTPLHVAACKGLAEIVRFLLEHEASPNIQSRQGHTPLFMACAEGYKDVVRALLEKGADVNLTDHGLQTATHMAAFRGHSEVIALLLGKEVHNTSLNARDIEGKTPLHYSCMGGHADMAGLMFSQGADANIRDFSSLTPLHLAANNGHTDIILLLMDKQVDVESKDVNNWTPMFCAAHQGHPGAIELLAAYGADVNALASQNLTPLLVACEGEAPPEVKSATVKTLLESGANPNLAAINGLTPLWSAVMKADVPLVSVLVQGGANINAADEKGMTPYTAALNNSLYARSEDVRKKYELITAILLSGSE